MQWRIEHRSAAKDFNRCNAKGTISPGTSSGFNAVPFDVWARSSPEISPGNPGLVDIGHWWMFSPQIIHEGREYSPEQKKHCQCW